MSNTLTCPFPSNVNPLYSNGFMFSITKLPGVSFFCKEVNLPEINLESAKFPTPLIDIKTPGTKLSLGDLEVTFMIDSTMANYKSIFNWMSGLGFPEDHEQYKKELLEYSYKNAAELTKNYSDGTLQVLDANSNPVATFTFQDLFPTTLSTIRFSTQDTSPQHLIGLARFELTSFGFDD